MEAKEELLGPAIFAYRSGDFVKGEKATLWDSQGSAFIDCIGGHGANNVGHCNPYVVEALKGQAPELIMASPLLKSPVRVKLYEKLAEITPPNLTHTFLSNSGTEAVEAALKFARAATGKKDFICFEGSFHGRSMGALSATWPLKYKKPFEPLVPGFTYLPFGDETTLPETVDDNIGAVLLEIIQGEGGINIPPTGYIKAVGEMCADNNLLLIVDEIQTGFCRTGSMFAFEQEGATPDILCLAKSIAGGLPMGATVFTDEIAGKLEVGMHGGTFGGTPLVCAAATAAIQYMQDEDLAGQAKDKGEYFISKLKEFTKYEGVVEVRGRGLMIAVEMSQDVSPIISALHEKKILALNAGPKVLRFLPPLVISKKQIDQVVEALDEIFKAGL